MSDHTPRVITRLLRMACIEGAAVPNEEQWKKFLALLEQRFHEIEQEFYLMERSLDVSSQEMTERWQKLKDQQDALTHQESLASVGMLSASLAHEINSPLTCLQLSVEQIADSANSIQSAETKAATDTISNNVATSLRMIRRISDLVVSLKSIVRDRRSDPMSPCVLSEILELTFTICAYRVKAQTVTVQQHTTGADNWYILCRPGDIAQVLINLIINALDALEKQKDGTIDLAITRKSNNIEIRVKDNGPGIPEHLKERVFESFYTTKDPSRGTGLGLHLSKAIVERHNGTLTIEPTTKGTCFLMVLPALQLS